MTSSKKSSKENEFYKIEKLSLKLYKKETGKDLYSGKLKKFFEGETPRKIKNVVKFIIINLLFLTAFIVSNKQSIVIFARVEEAVKAKKDIDPTLSLFSSILNEYSGVLKTLSKLELLSHFFSILAVFVQVIPFMVTNAYKFSKEKAIPTVNQLAINSKEIEDIYIKQILKAEKKDTKLLAEAEAFGKKQELREFNMKLRDIYNKSQEKI